MVLVLSEFSNVINELLPINRGGNGAGIKVPPTTCPTTRTYNKVSRLHSVEDFLLWGEVVSSLYQN